MNATYMLRKMSDDELETVVDRITAPNLRGQCPPEYAALVARELHRRNRKEEK